jgi:quinoprotein glucose dehydrogenase
MGPFPVPFEIPLGTPNLGGGVATASGLLFIAATSDRTLRAFDSESGQVLWRARLPADGMSTPLVYTANGREYVVIAAGGHHMFGNRPRGDALLAFALPAPE